MRISPALSFRTEPVGEVGLAITRVYSVPWPSPHFLSQRCWPLPLAAAQPNILWISSEDNGPHLGVYGDSYADTPNLDALGRMGMIYRNAWSTAPVCAPAPTTIISGMYPPSTGSQHMRSLTRLPADMRMFPQYLREAGYYVSNNSKEDYNLEKPGQVWDESSRQAHWRSRAPGQPFFAVFNFTVTHGIPDSQATSRARARSGGRPRASLPSRTRSRAGRTGLNITTR